MFPNMFADSILEASWAQRSRRSWTTLTSFGLQAVVICLLLMVRLLTAVGLPSAHTLSTPISAGRPDPGPARLQHSSPGNSVHVIPVTTTIMMPTRIPSSIPHGGDPAPESASEVCTGICDGPVGMLPGIGSGPGISSVIPGGRTILPTLRAQPERTFRTSSMLEGSLIRRVEPAYPPLAKTARVQGPVVLFAVISKAGTIENLRLLSGHPMLARAAIDAVSQWRYRPYILNNEPIEVETRITVNFILGN
jgi:periplasmic protein TonB